jgi:hypothetical protein
MKGRRSAALVAVFLAMPLGVVGCGCCDPRAQEQPDQPSALKADEAARVGSAVIELSVVRLVLARSLVGRDALDGLVHDTLLSERLRALEPGLAEYLRRVTLARRLSETFMREAREEGPPTDEEVVTTTLRHWWEIDRPAAARVTHAIVMCEDCADVAGARALAERVAAATAGKTDKEEFKKAVATVDPGAFKVEAQDLSPVAVDGRKVILDARPDQNGEFGRYQVVFAEAANKLTEVGQQSGIIRSRSGFHIILLTELQPEHRLPFEARRELLADEIVSARANRKQQAAILPLRQAFPLEVSRSFSQDTELLLLDP